MKFMKIQLLGRNVLPRYPFRYRNFRFRKNNLFRLKISLLPLLEFRAVPWDPIDFSIFQVKDDSKKGVGKPVSISFIIRFSKFQIQFWFQSQCFLNLISISKLRFLFYSIPEFWKNSLSVSISNFRKIDPHSNPKFLGLGFKCGPLFQT